MIYLGTSDVINVKVQMSLIFHFHSFANSLGQNMCEERLVMVEVGGRWEGGGLREDMIEGRYDDAKRMREEGEMV